MGVSFTCHLHRPMPRTQAVPCAEFFVKVWLKMVTNGMFEQTERPIDAGWPSWLSSSCVEVQRAGWAQR